MLESRALDSQAIDPRSPSVLGIRSESITLAEAYILGEELIDSAFQDSIMTSFRAMSSLARTPIVRSVIAEVVKIIYEGTPESSAARQFVAILYSEHMSKKDLKTRRDSFPVDFLFDVLMHKAPETKLHDTSPLTSTMGQRQS
ncbi:hypothetical protein Slin14017_G084370 [Septoria linicola]|nr:hypothetical protein Slin14017_G084370 [Septoria linicola]